MAKENVKVEEVLDGEEILETVGGENMKKKINWKLLAKCTMGVVIVGAASVALYKWRKSKKATTTVVVATPSDNIGANPEVAPTGNTTVVQI